MKKFWLTHIMLLILSGYLIGQNTIYFQGFENVATTCAENWGYTGGVRNSENNRTGSFAARVGRLSESNTLTFNTVNISAYAGVNLQIYHSVRGGSGPGMDTREGAVILVSLNGGGYTAIGRIGGFGDHSYPYTTTGGCAAGGCGGAPSSGCTIFQCANPLNYAVPGGTTTIAVQVVSVGRNGSTCAAYNTAMTNGTAFSFDRSDEGFFVDDVRLTTSTALGTPGLWTGNVSTDWFTCANWADLQTPIAATNVTINQTAARDCEVNTAGAVCASIALSSNNGTCRNLIVQNTGTLNCSGNITVSKTAGSNDLKLTLLNSAIFSCNNITMTGSGSGNENAQFENESSTAVLATINGNLTINPGGLLDLTNSPNYGIIHIKGDYNNLGLETDFKQTNSFVHFDGTGTQNINTSGFTEIFSNIVINKASNSTILLDNINIEQQLNMLAGSLNLNSNTATILNNATTGIIRTNGYVISEESGNLSKLKWQMGSTTGSHVFPFGKTTGVYIPFTFNLTAGTIGDVTVSTYPTAADNTPYPVTPNSVNDVDDYLGSDNSANVVDRFWQIDKTGGSGTADITFTYADPSEIPANGEASLVAQRYADAPTEAWQVPIIGQTHNAAANTVSVPGVTTFSPWTLSRSVIVLPSELLDYRGVWLSSKRVLLSWLVASENNVNHYVIEKSSDGKNYQPLDIALSHYPASKSYELVDNNPSSINYYNLYSIDNDGYKKFYKTIVLKQPAEISTIIETQDVLYIMNCSNCKAEIIDLSGKLIHSSLVNENYEWTKQSLVPGIYFLRLYDGEQIVNRKFVVF